MWDCKEWLECLLNVVTLHTALELNGYHNARNWSCLNLVDCFCDQCTVSPIYKPVWCWLFKNLTPCRWVKTLLGIQSKGSISTRLDALSHIQPFQFIWSQFHTRITKQCKALQWWESYLIVPCFRNLLKNQSSVTDVLMATLCSCEANVTIFYMLYWL